MDVDRYVAARYPLLVRAAVLMGRPPERAGALVERVLAERSRALRRAEDPDPVVLPALHAAVLADRAHHPVEAEPDAGADAFSPLDEEGLAVRRALGAAPVRVRDAAVLLYFARLGSVEAIEALDIGRRELPALATAALRALGARDGEDAHDRLARAAGTVAVEPPASPPGLPARRRLLPTVAVALVAAAAAGLALGLPDDPAPSGSGAGGARSTTLRGDQVPSLVGYRVPEALDRLRGSGLLASVERVDVCEPPDLVLETTPGVGATFRLGDGITVTAPRRHVRPCPGYRDRVAAWRFLGFASGREPAPRFARTVTVVDGGDEPVLLDRSRAGAGAGWGGVLSSVAAATARIGLDSSRYLTPGLTTRSGVPPAVACGRPLPESLAGRTALELTLSLPTEAGSCPLTVDLFRTPTGRVDAVVLRGPGPRGTSGAGTAS